MVFKGCLFTKVPSNNDLTTQEFQFQVETPCTMFKCPLVLREISLTPLIGLYLGDGDDIGFMDW